MRKKANRFTDDELLDQVGLTLTTVARPGMSPKDIIHQVRKLHPDASKKLIVRAAFRAVVSNAHLTANTSDTVYDFALKERSNVDE